MLFENGSLESPFTEERFMAKVNLKKSHFFVCNVTGVDRWSHLLRGRGSPARLRPRADDVGASSANSGPASCRRRRLCNATRKLESVARLIYWFIHLKYWISQDSFRVQRWHTFQQEMEWATTGGRRKGEYNLFGGDNRFLLATCYLATVCLLSPGSYAPMHCISTLSSVANNSLEINSYQLIFCSINHNNHNVLVDIVTTQHHGR